MYSNSQSALIQWTAATLEFIINDSVLNFNLLRVLKSITNNQTLARKQPSVFKSLTFRGQFTGSVLGKKWRYMAEQWGGHTRNESSAGVLYRSKDDALLVPSRLPNPTSNRVWPMLHLWLTAAVPPYKIMQMNTHAHTYTYTQDHIVTSHTQNIHSFFPQALQLIFPFDALWSVNSNGPSLLLAKHAHTYAHNLFSHRQTHHRVWNVWVFSQAGLIGEQNMFILK